jgi:hypothetical protein
MKLRLCALLILKKIIERHLKEVGTESKQLVFGNILLLFPRVDSILLLNNLS